MKLLYRPVGMVFSVLGGLLATALFRRMWRVVAKDDTVPTAKDADKGWGEVAVAAPVEGHLGGVKALVDRAGATAFSVQPVDNRTLALFLDPSATPPPTPGDGTRGQCDAGGSDRHRTPRTMGDVPPCPA